MGPTWTRRCRSSAWVTFPAKDWTTYIIPQFSVSRYRRRHFARKMARLLHDNAAGLGAWLWMHSAAYRRPLLRGETPTGAYREITWMSRGFQRKTGAVRGRAPARSRGGEGAQRGGDGGMPGWGGVTVTAGRDGGAVTRGRVLASAVGVNKTRGFAPSGQPRGPHWAWIVNQQAMGANRVQLYPNSPACLSMEATAASASLDAPAVISSRPL